MTALEETTSSGASLLPRAPEPNSRVLAVDYGRRRIGLALSDELGITARPFKTLERINRRSDLRRLGEVVRLYDVRRIIVGYPVHLDGRVGEMAREAARFAARLRKELGLEVELVDERLTSWEAEQILRETPDSSRRRNRAVDDVAAAVLLRGYLERMRGNAPAGAPESE
jgi:putative holliday junction resolvase